MTQSVPPTKSDYRLVASVSATDFPTGLAGLGDEAVSHLESRLGT